MTFQALKIFIETHKEEYLFDLIEMIFESSDQYEIYEHSELTAITASLIAQTYDLDSEKAYMAGYLHDLGRVVDKSEYITLLEARSVFISEDERAVPSCLHGKVSHIIARELLGEQDDVILKAIDVHTTLEYNPSDLSKVLFLADKSTWQDGDLLDLMHETLMQSITVTCFNTLAWLIKTLENRQERVFEETRQAYEYFNQFMIF